MILVRVSGYDLSAKPIHSVTSGTVGRTVSFDFSPEWSGLVKTAVFKGSGETRDVALLTTDSRVIPLDVLTAHGGDLEIGVYGRNVGGTIVMPTVWGRIEYIREGTTLSEVSPSDPEPDWTAQVQAAAASALEKAEAVEAAAARGDFDGTDGVTFMPAVSGDGTITWTNDGGLPNPTSVNIRGPQGEPGQNGNDGRDGSDGSDGRDGVDGVSPSVVVSTLAGGHAVTITDADHPAGQTFNVMDGEDGANAPIGLNITGADAGDLIKVTAVDANGAPTAWEPAVAGTDYPDPATYGAAGVTVSNNPDIGTRNYSIMLVYDGAARPLVIPDSATLDLIIGNSVEVGTGSGRLLIGGYNTVSPAQKNANPNLASIFVPVPDSVNFYGVSGISGIGATACGAGVNAKANGACAFGGNQLVTGTYSFTAGQMNYVSGRYAGGIGRLIEVQYNDQFAVGLSNDNQSTNAFEVGNGTTSTRSNAFYVTKAGAAIAKAALGIDDGNGGTVSVSASELQGVKALNSSAAHESWTFTLSDGTTVTKDVMLWQST